MSNHAPKAEVIVDYPYKRTQPPSETPELDWSEVAKLLTNPNGTSWLVTTNDCPKRWQDFTWLYLLLSLLLVSFNLLASSLIVHNTL